jgi:hypothetical protein
MNLIQWLLWVLTRGHWEPGPKLKHDHRPASKLTQTIALVVLVGLSGGCALSGEFPIPTRYARSWVACEESRALRHPGRFESPAMAAVDDILGARFFDDCLMGKGYRPRIR